MVRILFEMYCEMPCIAPRPKSEASCAPASVDMLMLLPSELPMFALKFKQWGWRGNELRYSFIALSGVVIALFGVIGGMWIVITLYFLTSVVADIVSRTHTTVDIEK